MQRRGGTAGAGDFVHLMGHVEKPGVSIRGFDGWQLDRHVCGFCGNDPHREKGH